MDPILQEFSEQHYLVFENEDSKAHALFAATLCKAIEEVTGEVVTDLSLLHEFISADAINSIRIKAFRALNDLPNWRKMYYNFAASRLKALFGPDISIQMKLNLSIQMPQDAGSVLVMHSDTLSGQSPFECVLWTSITDAFDSNAMYMFSVDDSAELYKLMASYQHKGMNQLFDDHKHKSVPLNVTAGTNVLFSSTLFHGNQLNETDKTRVSLNCRFKSLFSPEYATSPHERVTGTFYEPLFISPITRIGLNYNDQLVF